MTHSHPALLYCLLVAAVWLGLSPLAFGQNVERVTLTGTVAAEDTGVPLPGAHVILAGSTSGTVTDRHGQYTLADLQIGRAHV
jgi:TonB-dependent starch-binding outer membrane protein SusC